MSLRTIRGELVDMPTGAIMGSEMILPEERNWTDYDFFLERKTQLSSMDGFAPEWMPEFLFGFQRELVDWALRKGRSAIFADCGLGKTPMQLVWAENVVRHTNKPVLIMTPLAVGSQTLREAEKFHIEAHRSATGLVHKGINVVNYETVASLQPQRLRRGCLR